MGEQPDSLLAEFHELVTKLRKFITQGDDQMKYQLHDAPVELWAWVKHEAHIQGLNINTFIQTILEKEMVERKNQISRARRNDALHGKESSDADSQL